MRRKLKRYLAVGMAVMMLGGISAGCSAKSEGDRSGESAAVAEGGWKDQQITLQFWDNDTREEWQKATQELFDGFMKLYPNVKIERVMVPWNDINTKFQASVAAQSAPDFMYGSDKYIVAWAEQGSLAPLDDVLDEIGRDKFEESFLRGTTTGGKTYLAPIAFYPHVVFYRRDLYEKHDLQIPETWDELFENAKTIQDQESDVYGFDILAGKGEPYSLINFMSVNDASLLDAEQNVAVNSPETIETLEYLKKMWELIPNGSYGKSQADVRLMAIQGGIAHHIDSVSFAGTIAGEDKLEQYGAFPVPQRKGDYQAITGFYGFAVTSTDPDRLAATKALIKYMNEPEVYMNFVQKSVLGHIPANKTAVESDAYWQSERVAPFEEIFKVAVKAGKNGVVMGMERGANKYSSAIVSSYIYNDMMDKIILNNESPETVAAWAEEKLKTILDDVDNQ